MHNAPLELLERFQQSLEKNGTSLEKELGEIQAFRQSIASIPDVDSSKSLGSLAVICTVLPPQHAAKLVELSQDKFPNAKGLRGIKEVIEDLGSGSEDFLRLTISALQSGSITKSEGAGADFDLAMLEVNMLRYVILNRLADGRETLLALIGKK